VGVFSEHSVGVNATVDMTTIGTIHCEA